ncbi:MAG: VWA domain-containing protein [Acidobacteria bacterium]|nr:VWA domain-containing protein [Acidobacteriota bacterium]
MPLRHTEVRAEVTGFVARVEVVQTFGNPFETPIEATYVFPLPERAAVDDFVLEVGERRIQGAIRRREEARKTYEAARAAGYTASLLEQERPNVFTQSVSNIAPGNEIRIHLRYIDILSFADGAYRFLYPMVVGPRYSPTGAAPAGAAGVPLPSTIHLEPGRHTAHDIAITVDVDAGVPIHSITSESHKIVVKSLGSSRAQVKLARGDTLPNKDLMLRWDVAAELPEVGVLAHREDDDGFFALLVQPNAEVTSDEAAPKEILFVLDQSGSMNGPPIEMSQRFMRLALRTLGPRDRFNIVRFDGSATVLAPEPLANTQANVERGLAAVDGMSGSGGTEMLAGFDAALSQPRDASCIRIVVFLTDGFIGNEEDIFRVVRERRGDARIFTLGIGSSVNHHLLRGMADLGHGAYQYIRPDGKEKEAVERFQSWVTKPYLTDLSIDWGNLRVEDVQPAQLPDLYSGQTLSVVGRYLWGGTDRIIVRGRLGGVPWEKQVEVSLPDRARSHAALASVWARQRIQEWLMRPGDAARPEIEAQVTSLALAFHLMSPFTSFVAVDDSIVVNPDGNPMRVDQPLPMPEFVSFTGCFGAGGPGHGEALGVPERAVVQGGHPGVVAHGNIVDTSSTMTESNFNTESIDSLPVIGGNFQDVLTLTPGATDSGGDGNPNVQGGRATGLQIELGTGDVADAASGATGQNLNLDAVEEIEVITSGTSATSGRAQGGLMNVVTRPVEPSTQASPATRQRRDEPGFIEEAALHVLADLADDGRLSRSEGLPALAGLLGAQYSDGGFSLSLRAQALATWALVAAATSEPRLPWLPAAVRRAADFLNALRAASEAIDPIDDAWVDSILGRVRASGLAGESSVSVDGSGRCQDPRPSLERVGRDVGPTGARLIERILAGADVVRGRAASRSTAPGS